MRAFNIVWDMDNDDYINLNEQDALPPKEVFIPDLVWDEEIENVNGVADWLSDQYGFCVDSFDLDDMKENDICPRCGSTYIAHGNRGTNICCECAEEF